MNSNYTRHPDTHATGGLSITETNSGASSVFKEILKQMGKKMLEGSIKDMLKMSRPAKISSPTTHLMCISKFSDLMNEAAEQTDPVERMKYITAFLLSGLHCNPVLCKSKAPLNPILGETYQATKDDGTTIFLEQTCHHPPTSNYHIKGKDNNFEMFGYAIVNAQLSGMNTIKGWRDGKSIIKLKDGSLLSFNTPETRITGLLMGERILNYSGTLTVKDYTNKIESITTFSYKETGKIESLKKSFTSLFTSKNKETNNSNSNDQFTIQISKLDVETKNKNLVCEGHGSWLGQIYMDGKKYWSFDDNYKDWTQKDLNCLPSDSMKREDLIALSKEDFTLAQKSKDATEAYQRNDKKLREKFKNKNN